MPPPVPTSSDGTSRMWLGSETAPCAGPMGVGRRVGVEAGVLSAPKSSSYNRMSLWAFSVVLFFPLAESLKRPVEKS